MRQSGLAALVCVAAALAPAAAAAAERPAAALVFDSSYSMWSQIDGANKVVMLREALGERLGQTGKLDLAVLTYGAREEDACAAIDTVVPFGPLAADRYTAAIGRVAPGKGATPLARALRQAAADIGFENRPATIIVVSDGLDNCRTDPCATAAELKAVAPGLTIHAIAFDKVHQDELAGLSCMANETGGLFFPATSRAELDTALAAAFAAAERPAGAAARQDRPQPAGAKSAAAPTPPLPPAPPAAGGDGPAGTGAPPPVADAAARVARQAAQDESTGAANLRLRAVLSEGGPQLASGVVWRVFDARPDESGSFRVVARGSDPDPVFRLRNGRYVVHATYGRASATTEIEIGDDSRDETVVLNAGFLRLAAQGPNAESLPEQRLSFSIYSSEEDQFGERKLILSAIEPGKIVRLNAGLYQIVSQYGDANAVVRGNVRIEAGQLSEVVVSHLAAMITLKLVRETGGEALADTSWSVMSPQGEIVAESVGAFPSHVLAAGDYTVVARHDGRAFSRPFTVESGRDREIEVVTGRDPSGGEQAD